MIAKTPQLELAEVTKPLERGVMGVQLPQTEYHEQSETLRSYLKFPPHISRSVARGWGNNSYVVLTDWNVWRAAWDPETTVVVHIETRRGYQNSGRGHGLHGP